MLVPNMTLDEIRKEIEKDFPILHRKMGYVADDLKKKLKKPDIIKGFVKFDYYLSKYKNRWLYQIHITKKTTHLIALLICRNTKGHACISMLPNNVLCFQTGHFFERYNERQNLCLKEFDDIVKHYLSATHRLEYEMLEEISPEVYTMFGTIDSGVVLGTFNYNVNLIKINTFLTNEMLNSNQKELKIMLKEALDKYKDSSDQIT
jgi:hypothetical protein